MNDSHCSQMTETQPTLKITSSERIHLGGNRHGNSIDQMKEIQRWNQVALVNPHLIFTPNGGIIQTLERLVEKRSLNSEPAVLFVCDVLKLTGAPRNLLGLSLMLLVFEPPTLITPLTAFPPTKRRVKHSSGRIWRQMSRHRPSAWETTSWSSFLVDAMMVTKFEILHTAYFCSC